MAARAGALCRVRVVLTTDPVWKAALVVLLPDETKENPLLRQDGSNRAFVGIILPISAGRPSEYDSYLPLALCFLTL